jgi:hypothetical protein
MMSCGHLLRKDFPGQVNLISKFSGGKSSFLRPGRSFAKVYHL